MLEGLEIKHSQEDFSPSYNKRIKIEGSVSMQDNSESESSIDLEEKKTGFQLNIGNLKLIGEAAQEGKSGQLGQLDLEHPLNYVNVSLIRYEGGFGISAKIETEPYRRIGTDFTRENLNADETKNAIFSGITNQYTDRKEVDGDYSLNVRNRGTNFIIHAKGKISDVEISTGTTGIDPNKMGDVLEDLGDLLKVSIETIYKVADKTPPDEELILYPPEGKSEEKVIWQKPHDLLDINTGAHKIDLELEEPNEYQIKNPNVSLKDIGGQKEAKEEVRKLVHAINNPDSYKKRGTKPPKGILFYGPPGTGKTLVAEAVAFETGARFLAISPTDIMTSEYKGNAEGNLGKIFKIAESGGEKTIIFFDEIDAIARDRKKGAHPSEAGASIIATLLQKMNGIKKNNIIFIAATNNKDSIDHAFTRPGRFDRDIEFTLPDKDEREEVFKVHIHKAQRDADENSSASSPLFGEIDFESITNETRNMNNADIAEIIRRTLEETVPPQEDETGEIPPPVSTDDILRHIEKYKKSKKTDEDEEESPIENPKVSLKDIGGQEKAKREIKLLANAVRNPDTLKKWGAKPLTEVMLYGPPGTGKTLMAKALASEAGAQFLNVDVTSIAKINLDPRKTLKAIFQRAGNSEKKTIIFLNNLDAITTHINEVNRHTITALLSRIDSMKSNDNVIVLASAKRLAHINPAFLKAGYFDRLIEVGLPKIKEREEVFNIHIRKAQEREAAYLKGKKDSKQPLFSKINFEDILTRTESMSCADIVQIIERTVQEKAFQEVETGKIPPPVSTKDILEQIEKYREIKNAKEGVNPNALRPYI
jgi:transitional endoplasmic reticulum ATPase